MKRVSIIADNIISPMGETTEQNFSKVVNGNSGIRLVEYPHVYTEPFYASMFSEPIAAQDGYTAFESLCIKSIEDALSQCSVKLSAAGTILILCTTKGNIELAKQNENDSRLPLSYSAHAMQRYFGAAHTPVVISNACISGLLGIIAGMRLLNTGMYKHVVITGADVLSEFVVSGFHCLHAVSRNVCRPFDNQRDGINLGEAAATVVLSSEIESSIQVLSGKSSNDANHISGPSRTGQELAHAIQSAMMYAGIKSTDLSFISAHGTATIFNDEMESKAFETAELNAVPVHSLKPHFGHTLGAAGVLESIVACKSLEQDLILPSKNFEQKGVSGSINISTQLTKTTKTAALKTASGFGGCNAAALFCKN